MVPGLNSSVIHEGTEYHVQTEDLGEGNPHVLTLVYRAGAILTREHVNYREALGEHPSPDRVRHFMETQHRRIVREVAAGRSPGVPEPPAAPPAATSGPAPPAKSLDQLIAEYVRSRTSGKPR